MGWIPLIVIVLVIVFLIMIYNGLVTARNGYKNAFSQIDVQLQRRHDLIPNLVETAKGYIKHERETLEAVIAARNQAVAGLKGAQANPGDPQAMQALQGAEGMLTGAMSRFMALAEAYPDLKANSNFQQLQAELSDTENKIAASRRFYNSTVMSLNTGIQQFPGNLFAGMAGATAREFFELDEEEKAKAQKAPEVKF